MRKQWGKKINMGNRYLIKDLHSEAEYRTDDIIDAIHTADFLRHMGHDTTMRNTETGADFYWRGTRK